MKLLVCLLLCTSFSLIAGENYEITELRQDKNSVQVNYKSTKISNSICYLKTTSITITHLDRAQREAPFDGLIRISSKVDPYAPCMMAFGPHRGYLKLQKGRSLPALKQGKSYQLIINDEAQKQLVQIK